MDDDVASGSASQDARDEEDEEDYEENGAGNRLLGFMFGNVDDSGDLDVDYLDEDAKEHLAALADKLGPSLTDIDLIKSSPTLTDEQDYDEKAEDAIDYEDIDEQYDGPEIQSSTEEDHLLPKKDYFSSDTLLASLDHKGSVFDEENYDEEEETIKESNVMENNIEAPGLPSAGEQLEISSVHDDSSLSSDESPVGDNMAFELDDFQDQPNNEEEQVDLGSKTSLPVLCVEDGMVILKFSEIFGIHEPMRKADRKDQHRYSLSKERAKVGDVIDVEEDEEVFLRGSCYDLSTVKHPILIVCEVEVDVHQQISDDDEQVKDLCLCAQPMKDESMLDVSTCQWSSLTPEFYPLDQQDWENAIVWGNSPMASHGCAQSCVISELDTEANTDAEPEDTHAHKKVEFDNKDRNFHSDPVLNELSRFRNISNSTCQSLENNYHPQLLRLETQQKKNDVYSVEMDTEKPTGEGCRGDILHRYNKLSLQNKDLLNGSWLDQVVWDPDEAIPKPKLILDLQDEQMLFEIFDDKDSEHIRSHAGAMVMTRSSNSCAGDSFDLHNQGMSSVGRFNISNDKYYSNRKTSQQAKSHAKKLSFHGIKVMHSVPALRLQTMKPKLSNKDIANFHRPKALWYPHDNKVIAKAQGMLCSSGPIKIIVASLGGGKGIKLHINAEETLSTVKLRTSKKLDSKPSERVKVFYAGEELEDDKSLASQNVRPNSVLHLVRTVIHVWPRAQKLPGENKPLRPPGAFKKKSDLSVKDGHVFLTELFKLGAHEKVDIYFLIY